MKVYASGLTTALAGLSPTQLDGLETFWEIDPDAIGTSAEARTQKNSERLAAAMATIWAAMAVVEKLTDLQRQVLRRLLDESPVHHNAFADLGENPDALLRPLLENLVVLIVHSWSYGGRGARWAGKMPLPKDAYLGVPAELQGPLNHALELYSTPPAKRLEEPLPALMAEVRTSALGQRLGMAAPFTNTYAESLPGLLAGNLRRPNQLQKLLQSCSPRARRLFAELLKAGNPAPFKNLLSGPAVGAQEVLPLLEELHRSALVFPIFVGGKRACFVPRDVADSARGVTPRRPVISDVLQAAPTPAIMIAAGQGIWWDMMVAGLAIEAGRGDVTATTRVLPKKVLKQLAKSAASSPNDLGHPEDRIETALTWLSKSRLVQLLGSKIVPSDLWPEWCSSSLPEQIARILNSWIFETDAILHEFKLPAVTDYVRSLWRARLRLLTWLQDLTPGEWITTSSFLQRVLAREPYFFRSREAILALMGEAGIDDLYESWRRQEGLVVLSEMFDVPMFGGLVEVGWSDETKRRETPDCVRVSTFGAEILQQLNVGAAADQKKGRPPAAPALARADVRRPGTPRRLIAASGSSSAPTDEFYNENRLRLKGQPPPPERVLLVQPNLEIVLLRFDPRAAYAVGRFAQPLSFDKVGAFQITGESVRSAASRGVGFSEMKATLDRYGTGPTPQNVEYQINDWAGSVRRIRFERGTLVEVDSPEDLETLLSTKPMRARVIRRLSPTAALLSVGEDVKALGTTLEPQGFSWIAPDDWDKREEAAYTSIHKTLKRFEPKPSWGWR